MANDLITNDGALIPISEHNGKRAVSARDLYNFLECTERFQSWFDRQLQYGFVENVDFVGCKVFNTLANQELQDYAITIDMAKEVSMLQRSEKGKLARKYFIACEQKLREQSQNNLPRTYLEALKALVVAEEEKQRLALDNKVMKPKAEYFDNLVSRNLLTNLRDTAKQIHLTQKKFITLLLEHKFLYRDARNRLKPYAEYTPLYFEIKYFERNGHTGTQLLVNPKGKETFRLMWGGAAL